MWLGDRRWQTVEVKVAVYLNVGRCLGSLPICLHCVWNVYMRVLEPNSKHVLPETQLENAKRVSAYCVGEEHKKKQDKICRGSPPCIASQRHRSHTCFPTEFSSAYVEGYMRVNTWKKWNLFNTLKIENLDFRPFTLNRWCAQAHPRDPLLKKSWYLFVPNLQRIQID